LARANSRFLPSVGMTNSGAEGPKAAARSRLTSSSTDPPNR
jgi:hypothetical protein